MARSSSPDSVTGFVNLSKPAGMTSSDAVCIVRGVLSRTIGGRQKTGHLGTLDPLATGVLPIALGKATALFDFLAFKTKRYVAEFTFGTATDTLDRGGKTVRDGGRIPSAEEIAAVLARFTGEFMQTPPAYSAKSVNGRRAYSYARSGEAVELAPKTVRVDSFELISGGEGVYEFAIECGGGTYIRSLARDVAEALGTCAYMSALTRTKSGPFTAENAVTPDEFRLAPEKHIIPAEFALSGLKKVTLGENALKRMLNGIPAAATDTADGEYAAVYDEYGALAGLGLRNARGLVMKVRLQDGKP